MDRAVTHGSEEFKENYQKMPCKDGKKICGRILKNPGKKTRRTMSTYEMLISVFCRVYDNEEG